MIAWGAVNARARGLGSHLLGAAERARLASLPDLPALSAALAAHGLAPGGSAPEVLELAVRRQAADALRVLSRWATPAGPAAAVLYDDEDCRSLRSIVRGALRGVPAERRLAGLIPTPALPERALATLAALPTVRAVADLLEVWRTPWGAALRAAAHAKDPDALQLEVALTRAVAATALRRTRRREGALRAWVRLRIDLGNAWTALMLAEGSDVPVDACFIPGGSRVSAECVRAAAGEADHAAAAGRLAACFPEPPLAHAFRDGGRDPVRIERRLLDALWRVARARARVDPLGPWPLITFALRLRREVQGLQRIIWGLALRADAARRGGSTALTP